MALGELYKPTGKALEHVAHILQEPEESLYACNVAIGCAGQCSFCFGPKVSHLGAKYWTPRLPEEQPVNLAAKQLDSGLKPRGVFLSFLTDPYMNQSGTRNLAALLIDRGVKVATSTKFPPIHIPGAYHGITYITGDHRFHGSFEGFTTTPAMRRRVLQIFANEGERTWASLEPFPTSDIFTVDVAETVGDLSFTDALIFGKWNYDPRASTPKARAEYAEAVPRFLDACKAHGIRGYVKRETMDFAFPPTRTTLTEEKE